MNPILQSLINNGIPVSRAQFHSAVNNADQIPESTFSDDSPTPSRRVNMWYTPNGLVCHQKATKISGFVNKGEDRYFIVPLATIIFANFKKSDKLEEPMDAPPIMAFASNAEVGAPIFYTSSNEEAPSSVPLSPPKKRGRPFKVKT